MESAPDIRPPAGPPKPGIAERLWEAARIEFSERGYHGARVQGIARRAGCNVALLYRHWASKKALYVDILRAGWKSQSNEVLQLLDQGGQGAPAVVSAYLDALMRDPVGSQLMIRELLDGGPHLRELVAAEPELTSTIRAAAARLHEASDGGGAAGLRPGLDPVLVVLSVAGIASLAASAHEGASLFTGGEVPAERWRDHLKALLVNGIVPCP